MSGSPSSVTTLPAVAPLKGFSALKSDFRKHHFALLL